MATNDEPSESAAPTSESTFMTASGRAVPVDAQHLNEVRTLLETCEAQASTLSWTGGDDSAVPEQALQMPIGKHLACPTADGHPPHQAGEHSTDGIGLACKSSAIDDQRHNTAPAAMSQEGKPLGKFMTAGGRAVAVDTGHLKEAQALLEQCEVQANILPCIDADDLPILEPATSQLPSDKHCVCQGRDLLEILNPPHDPNQQGNPLGKLMTAGGRAVAVDTGRLKEAQALLEPCEVQASSLPWTGSEDSAVPEPAALQMPCGKHSACPTTGGLLELLNPPHQVGRNGTDGIGLACNTSNVDDQRHSGAPAAMSQEGKPLGKFMTAGGRAVAVDTGRLKEAQALLVPCEVQASSLPWTGSEDSAVPEPAALHMPHGKHSACPTTGGLLEMLNPPHQVGRNSTDGIGLACNTSAVDDQRHSAAPAAMSQEGKPLGKFMMAGGRAVAVDTGRLMEAQALFEPCEVQASSLPWTGSEDSAVPEPYTASGKALQGWAIEEEQAVAKVQEVSTCTGSLERAQTPLGSQSAGGVSPSKPAPCGIEKLESPCPDRHRKRPCILSNSPLLQLAGGLDDPCGNAGVPCFGQRHFSGDMLGSTWREDLELTQPTIDVSLLDWISEEDPPGIAQGFAIPQVCTENSARYDNRWLRTQLAQLCLLSARATRIISSNSESISERLAKRARAEISGRRSAIFQICAGLAPADQHMVLLCTAAVSEMCHAGARKHRRVAYSQEDAWVELSDGWYFIKASLDAELNERVRRRQIRPGRCLHICMASAVNFPADGCDPLQLPKETRLHLRACGCRPASSQFRLGFQRGWFPPAKINQLHGLVLIPSLDVVVVRILPPVLRHWKKVQREEGVTYHLEERSISQEQHQWEEEQARGESYKDMDPSNLQLQVIAIDAQALSRPGSAWWTSMAMLTLSGSPFLGEDPLRPLDRLRISSLRKPARDDEACSLKRIYCNRNTRLQHHAGTMSTPLKSPLTSPFCRGPPLFTSPQPAPASHFRGFFCDLIGVAIQASKLRRTTGGRQTCSLYLLTPALKVCQIVVQQASGKGFEVEHERRLADIRTCWNGLSKEAFAAAQQARLPTPVAVQHVRFEQDPHGHVAYFSSSALQILISCRPHDVELRHTLDFCFVSPADLLRAHSSCQADLL
ncbi:Brca2 [Symbiodinium natans]|uniref:Brca2 protein n=1 Tax=Symbiodinium natans TaxID=878477 RepID=A0A812U984_9DINO|nr:Brca2 [Symbiodinium natans]